MLAKYWKRIGFIILIVACLFNVLIKLINKLSFEKEMVSSAQYVYDQAHKNENTTNKETEETSKKTTEKTTNSKKNIK